MPTHHNILPAHARLLASDDVWIEGKAVDQLAAVARTPGCIAAAGLPDLHPGPGIPLGATFAFNDALRPALVGSDAGCGVRMVGLKKIKARGDDLERRLLAATDGPALPDADPSKVLEAVWHDGARGLLHVDGVPDDLLELAEREPPTVGRASGPLPPESHAGFQMGTVGGGNHFLEVSRVDRMVDRDAASLIGLSSRGFAIVVHSGSRGLGKTLSSLWGGAVLGPDTQDLYLSQLAGAERFAKANRFVLAWRALRAVGASRPGRIAGSMDIVHNTVERQVVDNQEAWVHRKGTAPANEGQLTVVLGSRGAPSWVMRGCGEASCLCSVAHGAGRRLNRSDAIALIKHRYTRASLRRTKLGGRVLCDDPKLLYAEHPDCYKDIESVVRSLESFNAATRVASLVPLATVKR